jgi:predicted RNA-binding protein with PUA-like domain
MNAMKKGDEVFFYHSNEGLDIVGIAKVAREAYQDPTTDDDRWVAVDLKVHKKLKKPVSLEVIKKDKRLANMALVRIGRLSVQPVTDKEHDVIMELAGE